MMRFSRGANNVLLLAILVPIALFACTGCREDRERQDLPGVTGTIERHADFESAFIASRNVDVWLPPGYARDIVRHPVLYMHDGQNLFDPAQSYIGVDWGVDEAMTALIDSGAIEPAIVVGIWNTPNRTAEYMPWAMAASLPEDEWAAFVNAYGDASLSDAYLRFIVEELKPFIDRRYRTKPDRDNTFIMGSSMGGLISLYAVTEYPDVFAGAGCVSTHWPIVGSSMLAYLGDHLDDPAGVILYFDYGTETLDAEYEPHQMRVDSLLGAKGFVPGSRWMTRKFEGADHSERAWRLRVHEPITMFFGR